VPRALRAVIRACQLCRHPAAFLLVRLLGHVWCLEPLTRPRPSSRGGISRRAACPLRRARTTLVRRTVLRRKRRDVAHPKKMCSASGVCIHAGASRRWTVPHTSIASLRSRPGSPFRASAGCSLKAVGGPARSADYKSRPCTCSRPLRPPRRTRSTVIDLHCNALERLALTATGPLPEQLSPPTWGRPAGTPRAQHPPARRGV
jgi:hypothetical protein